ncbi:MAG: hypothetical protein NWF06_03805 [Candidatus Bathyarchaeota archaeon]|nr:hypothetical protein [Candidatus Bathyarchaeum sp.]
MRDPDTTDWAGLGFYKECTFKYVKKKENGQIICDEYDFYAEDKDIVCGRCGQPQYTYLRPERTGVIRTCVFCNMTNGPISKLLGIHRKSYEIDEAEAVKILEARNAPKRIIQKFKKPKKRNSPLQKMRRSRERPAVSK